MTQLFRDIPNHEYHDSPALSRSDALTILRAGTATARFDRKHKEETYSPALKFGTMFHTAMESLDEFKRKYGMEAEGDRRTTAYKDSMRTLHAKYPDKEFVKRDDYEMVIVMADRIRRHPAYPKWVGKDSIREASFFGEVAGVNVKARPDLINLTDNLMVDWKTTSDGSFHGFAKSVRTFGYWLQPAWYASLVNDYFGKPFKFVFVCVEKVAPYNVSWYELDEDWLRYGNSQMMAALAQWKHSTKTGEWQAYSEELQVLPAPKFVKESVL